MIHVDRSENGEELAWRDELRLTPLVKRAKARWIKASRRVTRGS
jgi:hypothetical protein